MRKKGRTICLTEGNILTSLLMFAFPMIMGNILQQIYNIVDTIIVGKYIGAQALAAVGSAYTLMTFLTSVIIGLCMGSSALFSIFYGAEKTDEMKTGIWCSFCFILCVSVILMIISFGFLSLILNHLHIPIEIYEMMKIYVQIILAGIPFVFFYNFSAYLLRSVGNSMVPLYYLAGSAMLNILLDFCFVLGLHRGVAGAACATIIAQAAAGMGITWYTIIKMKDILPETKHRVFRKDIFVRILQSSIFTCFQQSVMNLGILMIQGLVNRFGTIIMAAFAAAVKIDTLAYMPAQEFGNAFSMFISQNYGAGKTNRIRKCIRLSALTSMVFCILISVLVVWKAEALMGIFVKAGETEVLQAGVHYLRIEGAFYFGIGCLFLLYGLYRGLEKPAISLLLTIISLGTRVFLAYLLAPKPEFGVRMIWWAIPIGWILADLTGFLLLRVLKVFE